MKARLFLYICGVSAGLSASGCFPAKITLNIRLLNQ